MKGSFTQNGANLRGLLKKRADAIHETCHSGEIVPPAPRLGSGGWGKHEKGGFEGVGKATPDE